MKLIGIEEHFLTAEIREAWNAIGLDAVDPSVAFHSGLIEGRLLNLAEERLALMDETGLDVQVLSLTTPMLHDLGPESIETARRPMTPWQRRLHAIRPAFRRLPHCRLRCRRKPP
jgi:hypothetical protein